MNLVRLDNNSQTVQSLPTNNSAGHTSSPGNKLTALALGLLAISGGAAAASPAKDLDTCQLTYLPKPCYDSWSLTNTFSSIPFQSRDYDGIERRLNFLDKEKCFLNCKKHYQLYNSATESDCSRTYYYSESEQSTLQKVCDCSTNCFQRHPRPNLQGIFADVPNQERIYQSATKKLTSECEFWKNIITTLSDENAELFSLDTQNMNWELSLFPDASDVNEKVQVFRNGVPDYCLHSNHLPAAGNRECADLSFAKSYTSDLHSINPSTLKEKMRSPTTRFDDDNLIRIDVNPVRDTVEQIKKSVALNDPNQHETAIQSITGTIAQSKKEIVENIKKACASHRRKASENAFKFWSDADQTSWVVADKNDNVFYSFTLKA